MKTEQKDYIHKGLGKYLIALIGNMVASIAMSIVKLNVTDQTTFTTVGIIVICFLLFFSILELIGLFQAGKSGIKYFTYAAYFEIFDAIYDFVVAIIPVILGTSLDNTWVEAVGSVVSVISFTLILLGYVKTANEFNYSPVLSYAALIFYVVGFILSIVTLFLFKNESALTNESLVSDLAISIGGFLLSIFATFQCYKKTK